MRIAVAGGTGVVGRPLVRRLTEQGHEVVVLSRSTGIDVATGAGLDRVMRDIDAVVDVLSVATTSARRSTDFFEATTRRLLDAEARAGIPHHVALSIVNVDRIDADYYAGKWAQERAIEAGAGDRWSILRATQFHEFAPQVAGRGRLGPLVAVPVMRTQPVAADEVAARLAELAVGAPQGRVPDLAGPREESLVDMVRRWLRASRRRTPVVPAVLPGGMFRAAREGRLLPGASAVRGTTTFDEWLRGQNGTTG